MNRNYGSEALKLMAFGCSKYLCLPSFPGLGMALRDVRHHSLLQKIKNTCCLLWLFFGPGLLAGIALIAMAFHHGNDSDNAPKITMSRLAERLLVIGPNDLRRMTEADFKLKGGNMIGRILVKNHEGAKTPYSYCTGILIDPSLVLTAAHCLADSRDKSQFTKQKIYYQHAYHRDKKETHLAVELKIVKTGHPTKPAYLHRDGHNYDYDYDWAILETDGPIKVDKYMQIRPGMTIEVYRKKFTMTAGYGTLVGDKEYATIDDNCDIKDQLFKNLITFDCDTSGASSGGPIYACNEKGDCWLYAIVSGEHHKVYKDIDDETLKNTPGYPYHFDPHLKDSKTIEKHHRINIGVSSGAFYDTVIDLL